MNSTKKRVLFVDDDTFLLAGLRRLLRSCRDKWDMAFVESGEAALEKMAAKPFDVVVSDMRMPGMSGAQLLCEVRKLYPDTVRIILSGQSDQEVVFRAIGPAHQYLSKPCDNDVLTSAIACACTLRDHLTSEAVRNVVGQVDQLPAMPSHVTQLIQMLQDSNTAVDDVAAVISMDLAMTAKVLQLVNSSFFGLKNHIADPAQAAALLGIDQLRPLILSASVYAQFDVTEDLSMDELTDHCLAVGTTAREIVARQTGIKELADQAMIAGMLHDVGKLLLVHSMPEQFQRAIHVARSQSIPLWEAEQQVFGATHADVGATLLGLWGLPAPVVEAVAFHHQPSLANAEQFSPLVAVHVANVWANEQFGSGPNLLGQQTLDQEFLDATGVADQVARWEETLGATAR